MLRVKDIQAALEKLAPESWAFDFDKVGLQVGDPNSPVTRVCLSLDSSLAAAQFSEQNQCQLLISHHPLIFHPLSNLVSGSHVQNVVVQLVKSGVAFIGCHTNWDVAPGGVNDALANQMELQNVTSFGASVPQESLKLITFAPEGAIQPIIDALSQIGCGKIGQYDRCAFFQEGTGTFLAGENSNPTVGRKGIPENVREFRVEMLIPSHLKDQATKALIENHPYEEPAFDFIPLLAAPGPKLGRIGELRFSLSGTAFKSHLDTKLDCQSEVWLPESIGPVEKVAVIGGAAASEWPAALKAGAHAFITGEVPQHIALEATEAGLIIAAAGHYNTEQPGVVALAKALRTETRVDVIVYEPEPGQAGRPLS